MIDEADTTIAAGEKVLLMGDPRTFGGHCRFGRVRHGWRIASAALIVLGVCGLRLTNSE